MKYYVYTYLDSTESINITHCDIYFEYRPIYIGKGKDNRMFDHLRYRKNKKNRFYNKLNKMIRENNLPIIKKVKEFDNEKDALDFEITLIDSIKNIRNNGLLYNTTNGGKGISGYRFTHSSKEKRKKSCVSNKTHLRFPCNKGDKHPMFGKEHTKESKQKISKSKTGKKQTKEWIENRVSKLRCVPLSDVHKDKLSLANKGLKRSNETKKRISESKKGSKPWNHGMIKDIILQIDNDDNIVREWDNLIEIENSGYQKSNVINVCNGKRKLHKGYKWVYKSNYYKIKNL